MPERSHGRGQPFEHALVRILLLDIQQRNGRVVGVIGVEPEDALAQPVIPAKRLGSRFGRRDQVFDNGRRNVVAVQRRVKRRSITA